MNINTLVGLRLESCRLSKSSYTLEFDGEKDGEFYTFEVGTSSYLSFENSRKDACEEFSTYIWEMLETNLISVTVKDEQNEIIFKLENDKKFIIWGDDSLVDNLLMIKNTKTGDWFTVL